MQVVIFDSGDRHAVTWSKQFVDDSKLNRASVAMKSNVTPQEAVKVIDQAAQKARNGGTIIFAVGHGSMGTPGDTTSGWLDVAPKKKLRLGGRNVENTFHDVFYDLDPDGAGPSMSGKADDERGNTSRTVATRRQANFKIYQSIGELLSKSAVRDVIFLSCNAGNATDFIRKIANDWKIIVRAYKRRVVSQEEPTTTKVRFFLYNDVFDTGTNTVEARTRIPQVDFYSAGPPL